MKTVYFDNSATTRPSGGAVAAMRLAMEELWGNPSSVHAMGGEASVKMNAARSAIVKALGVKNPRSGTFFFTGSGTESDNLAVSGSIYNKTYRFKPRIITTDSEHPAVSSTLKAAEEKGFEIIRLSTAAGVIDMEEYEKALTPETVLVTVMRVNNETGAVYPVPEMFALAKQKCPGVITHCDAVQGFLKLGCSPAKLNADLVTVSGHKIGGPKGIGGLWCGEELLYHKKLRPVIYGGGQENGIRSGTENVIGILGMGAAAAERGAAMEADREQVTAVRNSILAGLPAGAEVNLPKGEYLPNILSIYVPGVKSEVMVRELSSRGICVSAGSACSSGKLKTSPVLLHFGLSPDRADSTLRVSISHENTVEDGEILCAALADAMGRLAKKN